MGFQYRVKTKRSGLGDKKAKYHAVPVYSGEMSTKALAKELASMSALSEGDVRSTLIGLAALVEKYLYLGYSVRLEDLGLFTLSVSSDGYDRVEDCTPHRVKAKKVCFRADPQLKANLSDVTFERNKSE